MQKYIKRFLEEDIELGEYMVINPCSENEIIGSLESYKIDNNNLTLDLELENKCKIKYIIENIKDIVINGFTNLKCITDNASVTLEVF